MHVICHRYHPLAIHVDGIGMETGLVKGSPTTQLKTT
jgi:hypothetical protein